MDPGAQIELLALLSGVRRLPLKEAKTLSEEHKAVLLVVLGHRELLSKNLSAFPSPMFEHRDFWSRLHAELSGEVLTPKSSAVSPRNVVNEGCTA